jgi:hypothetical protein
MFAFIERDMVDKRNLCLDLDQAKVGIKSCSLMISVSVWRHSDVEIKKKKKNWGICIAPTQPFRAALGAERRVLPG